MHGKERIESYYLRKKRGFGIQPVAVTDEDDVRV
jgi:hypothetical protein